MNRAKVDQCIACQQGEIPASSCMRNEPHRKGVCPVRDSAPKLTRKNDFAREVYDQVKGTAVQISSEKRNYQYLRATEVAATFDLLTVDPDSREELWGRLKILEGVANDRRPAKKRRR